MVLSKSRYLIGLQCPKRLWWTVHEPHAPELAAAGDAIVLRRGTRVGELARAHVPGGVLVDLPAQQLSARVAATQQALAQGAQVVYEAAFQAGGAFASVDILQRRPQGFVLTEVKSTLDVKPEHLPDVALQTHVLASAGLDVQRSEVMHLNRECRHPELSQLFVRTSVTAKLRPLLAEIPARLAKLDAALASSLPEVETGQHCSRPHPCPFQARCWPAAPEHHLGTLYRINSKKLSKLAGEGYRTLHDLPEGLKLSPVARRQVQSVREGRVVLAPGLEQALKLWQEPLAFLDFETIMPAVPAFPGCGPYEQVPVQFSCHLLRDGEVTHQQWLAPPGEDPRPAFAQALLEACAGATTVVAYNASFELGRIDSLARHLAELAQPLAELRSRVVDLLPLVRDYVYHPGFAGSFSLKAVLPALVPELGYQDLEVKEGSTAAALLEALLVHPEALTNVDLGKLRGDLLRYCERDTLAMLRLYQRLVGLAGGSSHPDSVSR